MVAPPAPKVMAPFQILLPPKLTSAPAELTPVPIREVMGVVMVVPPLSVISAPLVTAIPDVEPKPVLLFGMLIMPTLSEVAPV